MITPKILNVGTPHFVESLKQQGAEVTHLDWRPPAGGDPALAAALVRLSTPQVEAANHKAVEIIVNGHPVLTDIRTAGEVIPGMTRTTILHAGPPNQWATMSGPQRGAIIGALILEGLAANPEAAEFLAASGEITYRPNNDRKSVV